MITAKMTTLPDSIAGLYEINMELLVLTPILLSNKAPSQYYLKEIRFENGLGIAVFNGITRTLNVRFDKQDYSYSFYFRGTQYTFQIHASLYGVSRLVDVNIVYDFRQL